MKDKEDQTMSISQMLEEGISNAFSNEYYQRFLAFVARNPNYSYRNVILILQQCPHAEKTKGIRTWNKEGRMIKPGETGLRINAFFESDKDKEEPPPVPSKKKRRHNDSKFRRVSVFDISQTMPMDGDDAQESQRVAPAGNVLEIARPQGAVPRYDESLRDLREVSPIPIVYVDSIHAMQTSTALNEIIIRPDMGELHTIRYVIFQIALVWLRALCLEQGQPEIAAKSVLFIVCRHIGLSISGLDFDEVTGYSNDREQHALEGLLDAIQKTALYFIDTLDGVREARRIGYPADEYFLFTNKKTAMRLFGQGHYVYLVYPGQGELLAMNKDTLAQYDGPFAVPREGWFGVRADSLAA